MLTKLIHSLENRGYHNLYIIDNQSTYPPLLEYYTRLPYPVYMLNKNVGHLSLWETGIFKQFKDSYYAYTDSDLEILPNCPDDFIEKFILLLQKYPKALKAGFSICIDDLPDHYKLKEKLRGIEKMNYYNILSADENDIAVQQTSFDDIAISKETVQSVFTYLSAKDELTKKIFYLYYYMDKNISEIALLFSVKESTIKNRLYRTIRELRQNLDKED